MQIAKDTVVTLNYRVTDPDGNLIDDGQRPLVYLHGGYDGIFSRIEEALHGMSVGEQLEVKLQPDDAFGDYDADLVRVEALSMFPEGIQVGMQFERARRMAMTKWCIPSPTSRVTRWWSTAIIRWPARRWSSTAPLPMCAPPPPRNSRTATCTDPRGITTTEAAAGGYSVSRFNS